MGYCGAQEAGRIPWGCEPQCDECREYEHAEGVIGFAIPVSLQDTDESTAGWPFRRDDVDDYEPDYTEAERLIGREICKETRKYDLREMKRAANPRLGREE